MLIKKDLSVLVILVNRTVKHETTITHEYALTVQKVAKFATHKTFQRKDSFTHATCGWRSNTMWEYEFQFYDKSTNFYFALSRRKYSASCLEEMKSKAAFGKGFLIINIGLKLIKHELYSHGMRE